MENNGIHIRVGDVIYGIIKHRVLILALTVVGLMIGVFLSGLSFLRGEMSKEYMITSSFSVNTQTNSGMFTSGYDFPNYNDINMAENITDAVTYVVKSDKMLTRVIDSLGLLGVTTKDIGDNIKFSQYNETQIIEMSLYWRSAKEGINILSEINRLAPEVLQETLRIGSVSVINEPSSEYLVGGSLNIILWGSMAILGFGLGIGITMLELIMHPTLLNVQDIEKVFGMEVLCEIADDKAYFGRRRSVLLEDEEHSPVGESFASAAHIIQNHMRKRETPHIIYITSALRGEGKTSMIANLAVQLSDLEKRVLLIDFDMKNPNLGRFFLDNVDYDHSLNALYVGDITEKDAVTTLTGYLDLIPTVFEKSSIPLDSNLFNVVRKLADGYDYVLIDTAPIGFTADPMSLGQIASAALFVVHYDAASMHEIKDSLERIEKSGVSVLGCLVNGVQVSERGISNPVKERERMMRAENVSANGIDPLTSLNQENQPILSGQEEDGVLSSMMEDFMGDGESETLDDLSEVTTDESFVSLLFQAENNRMETEEEEEIEEIEEEMEEETDTDQEY